MPALHSFGRTQQEAVWRAKCSECGTCYAANGERPFPLYCTACIDRAGIEWSLSWRLGQTTEGGRAGDG